MFHVFPVITLHSLLGIRALCYKRTPRLRKFLRVPRVFLETARAFCTVLLVGTFVSVLGLLPTCTCCPIFLLGLLCLYIDLLEIPTLYVQLRSS